MPQSFDRSTITRWGEFREPLAATQDLELHLKLFRVLLPLEMLIPMAEVSRPVLLKENSQKLRQNRKKIVMARLRTSINGRGTTCRDLDLKQKHQANHKGTCSPALCQPVHWAPPHIPSEVWAPPTSIPCFEPPLSVIGTCFAAASCSWRLTQSDRAPTQHR